MRASSARSLHTVMPVTVIEHYFLLGGLYRVKIFFLISSTLVRTEGMHLIYKLIVRLSGRRPALSSLGIVIRFLIPPLFFKTLAYFGALRDICHLLIFKGIKKSLE